DVTDRLGPQTVAELLVANNPIRGLGEVGRGIGPEMLLGLHPCAAPRTVVAGDHHGRGGRDLLDGERAAVDGVTVLGAIGSGRWRVARTGVAGGRLSGVNGGAGD